VQARSGKQASKQGWAVKISQQTSLQTHSGQLMADQAALVSVMAIAEDLACCQPESDRYQYVVKVVAKYSSGGEAEPRQPDKVAATEAASAADAESNLNAER
jgi:hypothetical protein